MAEEFVNGDIVTLKDEEGNEEEYELVGKAELDGSTYYALIPSASEDEYVILKLEADEEDEYILTPIEDDEEFDRVADYFDDELFSDVDYDEE